MSSAPAKPITRPKLALTLGAPNAGPRVGPVVINEIHYQAIAGDAEFIELKNITASPCRSTTSSIPI
jgi:hypothetical protein